MDVQLADDDKKKSKERHFIEVLYMAVSISFIQDVYCGGSI